MVESDIYSMGVTLYEMATGCLPFEGENSVSVALKHLQEEMVPPIVLNPELPRALNDIILKATRKQPSQRYHSAKEMRQDLLRVLREPDGDFARQAAEEAPVRLRRPRKPKTRGILRLVAVAIALIAMFGILLMTGRSMMGKEANANADLVPTLVGKTLEEAKKAAKLRAYTTEVVATIASSEYPSGVVTEQKPAAGSPLKAGGVISITVSAGAEMPRVPDLIGMTLDDAENALTDAGLSLGNVEYRVSDAPLGTVFQQDPVPETSLLQGDDVNLFISGEPSKNVEMIDVTNMTLAKALPLLRERDFTSSLSAPPTRRMSRLRAKPLPCRIPPRARARLILPLWN
jgi:serine/threonine-protein kinase